MKIIFFLLLSVITDIKKVLLSIAFEEKMNFCTLLCGGLAKVVFPMLKMHHFRECVKKTTFCFTSKSVLCFFQPPIRDIFAV